MEHQTTLKNSAVDRVVGAEIRYMRRVLYRRAKANEGISKILNLNGLLYMYQNGSGGFVADILALLDWPSPPLSLATALTEPSLRSAMDDLALSTTGSRGCQYLERLKQEKLPTNADRHHDSQLSNLRQHPSHAA